MKYIKHFLTILKHKWYVGVECFKMRLYWQGIVHDLSKFHPIEFCESAKYFTGYRSPIELRKQDVGYSLAWLHHKGRNKHHWQYWLDTKNGKVFPIDIPMKYLKEMACDMIGASKTYKNSNPYEYWMNNKDKWIMTDYSKYAIEELLIKYK